MKILWFTYEGIGLTVAKKLQEEGHEVRVGMVEDIEELEIEKEEKPEDAKQRLSTFDGIIEKQSAESLLKEAESFEDKDDWSVICDFNNLFAVADKLRAMGFGGEESRGFVFLPTREQYELESDRSKAKEFVKAHYAIEVGEKHDFKTTDEGIAFLQEAAAKGQIWVLKAYNDDLNAIVPTSDDPMLAKDELISAMASDRAGYEMQGYLLEEKITKPLEITPQIVFYDGDPVFHNIDIETKPLLAGDTGPQTGCSSNLVSRISGMDPIAELAFPPIVFDMARQHRGLFVWDASILIDGRTGKKYFGEFCANRWGWDAFFTELSMCDSVGSYFEEVMRGSDPLRRQFGAAVRMFNVKKNADYPIIHKGKWRDLWLYDAHMVKKAVSSIGYSWDLLVATGAGNSIEDAVDATYERLREVAFTGGGYRPKFDFLSMEFPTSILNRWNAGLEAMLYYGQKWEGVSVDERVKMLEDTVERLKTDGAAKDRLTEERVQQLRDEVIAALESNDENPD